MYLIFRQEINETVSPAKVNHILDRIADIEQLGAACVEQTSFVLSFEKEVGPHKLEISPVKTFGRFDLISEGAVDIKYQQVVPCWLRNKQIVILIQADSGWLIDGACAIIRSAKAKAPFAKRRQDIDPIVEKIEQK